MPHYVETMFMGLYEDIITIMYNEMVSSVCSSQSNQGCEHSDQAFYKAYCQAVLNAMNYLAIIKVVMNYYKFQNWLNWVGISYRPIFVKKKKKKKKIIVVTPW